MYAKNELMFPHYAIQHTRDDRGPEWRALVDRVLSLPESHPEVLAFMLMMIRLNGCLPCETDSYRAMRGCVMCVKQTLRRYKGTDEELIQLYHDAHDDVQHFMVRAHAPQLAVDVIMG
jgi:hypothetical protein